MLTKEMEIFMEENQAEVKALLWKLCEIPHPVIMRNVGRPLSKNGWKCREQKESLLMKRRM